MSKRSKTIIDCNVIISAGLGSGNCKKVIARILRHHKNYISKDVLGEYREVISRKKFISYRVRLLDIIKTICDKSILVDIDNFESDFSIPDPKDKIYLKTGIKGNCDFLITGNIKDFPKLKYKNLQIISPADFLKL